MNRRSSLWPALALVTCLIPAACSNGGGTPTQPAGASSQQPGAYLDQLLGIMQGNSINRLTIDWNAFRTSVLAQGAGAQSIPDTYPAIKLALTLLGDGHSFFLTPTGTSIYVPNRTCTASSAGAPALPSTIGYVKVGSFSGSGSAATAFANGIQNAIIAADRDDLTGWIVDVRGNLGGNMWPMIAGVGPVLGDGVIGYFIDPLGAESVWEYHDGASWLNGFVQQRVDTPYRLRHERPRVAVLTDNGIASSGEATVVALRQRPDTRSFGSSTCGLSTNNRSFSMSDGASLILTVSVMADRTRTKYGDSIPPDEIVTDPTQAVQRALAWLQSGS